MFTEVLLSQNDCEDVMDVNISRVGDIDIVEMFGRFDTNSAGTAQDVILPLAHHASKIILDMSHVTYMSSAGLRILLMIYRTVNEHVGNIVLAGLNEELIDVMAITGFLDFFTIAETTEIGIKALKRAK